MHRLIVQLPKKWLKGQSQNEGKDKGVVNVSTVLFQTVANASIACKLGTFICEYRVYKMFSRLHTGICMQLVYILLHGKFVVVVVSTLLP